MTQPRRPVTRSRRTGLVDLLDQLLAVGVTVSGDVRIRLADVDLVDLDLRLLLCSVTEQAPASREATGVSAPGPTPAPRSTPRPAADLVDRGRPADRESPSRGLETGTNSLDQGLGRLVVAVVELVRQLLERQAIRRKRAGSLDDGQQERLGAALRALELQVAELREALGVKTADLDRALSTIEDALRVQDPAVRGRTGALRREVM